MGSIFSSQQPEPEAQVISNSTKHELITDKRETPQVLSPETTPVTSVKSTQTAQTTVPTQTPTTVVPPTAATSQPPMWGNNTPKPQAKAAAAPVVNQIGNAQTISISETKTEISKKDDPTKDKDPKNVKDVKDVKDRKEKDTEIQMNTSWLVQYKKAKETFANQQLQFTMDLGESIIKASKLPSTFWNFIAGRTDMTVTGSFPLAVALGISKDDPAWKDQDLDIFVAKRFRKHKTPKEIANELWNLLDLSDVKPLAAVGEYYMGDKQATEATTKTTKTTTDEKNEINPVINLNTIDHKEKKETKEPDGEKKEPVDKRQNDDKNEIKPKEKEDEKNKRRKNTKPTSPTTKQKVNIFYSEKRFSESAGRIINIIVVATREIMVRYPFNNFDMSCCAISTTGASTFIPSKFLLSNRKSSLRSGAPQARIEKYKKRGISFIAFHS